MGKVLDKTLQYKKVLLLVTGTAIIATTIHCFAMPSGSALFEIFTMLLVGPALLPISSVCFSFAGELAYPVPEA